MSIEIENDKKEFDLTEIGFVLCSFNIKTQEVLINSQYYR